MYIEGGGGGKKPCRFQQTCRQWKQTGTCRFLHNNQNQNQNQNPVYQKPRRDDYMQYQNQDKFNNQGRGRGYINNNNNNLPNDYQSGGGMGGGGNPNHQYNNPNPMYNQPKQNNPKDAILFQFCKFYQTMECKNDVGCKKMHGFTHGDLIKRVMKTKDVPKSHNAKLCTLDVNGTKFFTLRLDNVVTVFQYNSETGQIIQLPQSFALDYPNIHWYFSRQKYIYFAYENNITKFTNIGFIDVITKQRVIVESAHKQKVTGMVHIEQNNQPIVLSCSTEGTIKVWRIQGEKLTLIPEATEGINNHFKSNTNFEVLFLNKQIIQGNQVLTAGTSDNRLLFWLGPNMTFQQKVFEQPHNRILSIKYIQTDKIWAAIVIAHSKNNESCALLAVNLVNFQHAQLTQQHVGKNIWQLYTDMQSIGGLFFLATFQGTVFIYKIPDFKTKIGCIMHTNSVTDLVSYTSLTQTKIELNNLFVLQKIDKDRPGSFAVYSIR